MIQPNWKHEIFLAVVKYIMCDARRPYVKQNIRKNGHFYAKKIPLATKSLYKSEFGIQFITRIPILVKDTCCEGKIDSFLWLYSFLESSKKHFKQCIVSLQTLFTELHVLWRCSCKWNSFDMLTFIELRQCYT